MARPSSIADRLTLLDQSQEGWRDRVGETDVKKFTIEHKIETSGKKLLTYHYQEHYEIFEEPWFMLKLGTCNSLI